MAFVLGAKGSEEKAGHGAAFPQIGLPASRRNRVCVPHAFRGRHRGTYPSLDPRPVRFIRFG